jgi:hypothetical protein
VQTRQQLQSALRAGQTAEGVKAQLQKVNLWKTVMNLNFEVLP